MEFSSIFNIWVFIPALLSVYYLVLLLFKGNERYLNIVLFVFSLFFYCWNGISNLFIITLIILNSYLFGLWINCFQGEGETLNNPKPLFKRIEK